MTSRALALSVQHSHAYGRKYWLPGFFAVFC